MVVLNGGSENKRSIRETQMGAPRIAPTIFDEGAVGLRIVIAMIESVRPVMAKLKSDPIAIRPMVMGPTTSPRAEEKDDVARSESYTCVIEREGGMTVRTTVYYDGDGIRGKFEMNSGVFFESSAGAVGPIPADFLSSCYLCRRKLHGLDIFMYMGDEAFCSVECRCQQIISDEQKENLPSKTGKPRDPPLSSSYLSPLPYDAVVVAA